MPKIDVRFETSPEEVNDHHVRSSVAMIAEAAELAAPRRAAIFGSGRCTEVPLRFLAETFEHVDVIDIDPHALRHIRKETEQWEESCRRKVSFHAADLTGLVDEVRRKASARIALTEDPGECAEWLARLLDSSSPRFWKPADDEMYSLVVCSAILTQLQAGVRGAVEGLFRDRFPGGRELRTDPRWRAAGLDLARRLEDGFIAHLRSVTAPNGVLYLADTVHCCYLSGDGPQRSEERAQHFSTEGSWLASRTSCLADYLPATDRVVAERRWEWVRKESEGGHWGCLYGVQAVICRMD